MLSAIEQNKPVIDSILAAAADKIEAIVQHEVKVVCLDGKASHRTTTTHRIVTYSPLRTLVAEICAAFNVDLIALAEKKRAYPLPIMRQAAIYVMRFRLPKTKLREIAAIFKMHHSSVIYSVLKAQELIEVKDELFLTYYDKIKHLIDLPLEEIPE